ncbi:MAG TPA: hypothetical protein VHM16_02480, partial [Rubrobacteraceae bacterium]|nr:hypothetical protein [Rubrobacteraceae bacterium]
SKGGGNRITMLLISLAAGLLVALLAALPAYAELTRVSPRVDRTGFPSWYQDNTGVRVKLCVDSPLCLRGDPRPDRTKPATIANRNLPDEAFYAAARAETDLDDGGKIRWRAVLEGAFSSPTVRPNRQITFTRTQVTGSNINLAAYPVGTVLSFQTPYGEMTGEVESDGTLKTRLESPLGVRANGFRPPVTETVTGYGPTILKWDSGAPAGFLGRPLVPHTITGGDGGVNTFRVFEGADPVSPLVTRFEIAGQCVQGTC